MKINFKGFLSVAMFFAAVPAFSQVSIGIQGGATWANPSIKAPTGLTYESNSRTSFQAGLMFDVPLGDGGLRIMPELKYADKMHGFSTNVTLPGQGNFTYAGKSNISYLELPVHLAYAFGGDTKIIIGAGPYVAYGLSGKNEYTISTSAGTVTSAKEDIQFGSGASEIKRMDLGASGMAGILLQNGFMVKVNYGLGLTNLYSANTNGASYKQKYLGASVVYFFKR